MNKNLHIWKKYVNQIEKDVSDLMIRRKIYNDYLQIVNANPSIQTPIDFHDWVRRNYAIAMSILVRKQTDGSSIGLQMLLKEIKNNPQDLNSNFYESLYSKESMAFAKDDFFELAGSTTVINEGIIDKDMTTLSTVYFKIGKYASKKIAHNTTYKFDQLPTYNDLDEAILLLEKLAIRYIRLLSGDGIHTLEPIWQYDWQAICREKWIK